VAKPTPVLQERLVLRPGGDDLHALSPWFEAIAGRADLPSSVAFRIHVVLEEAVTNAMLHGQDPGDAGEVTLELTATPDRVVAVLRDTGRPFDPLNQVPSAPEQKPIAEAMIGGLGVTLMRTFCSELSYQRSGATNELTMQFDLNATASAGDDK
jgi:anti-sigma regulatory factor (Ser/Thr protein kinase)